VLTRVLQAVLRKLVPGVTTALCSVGLATLTVSAIYAELLWFGTDAAIRVGLPAFVAGILFFPANERTLASRLGFALRSGFATAGACLAHRILWASKRGTGELPDSVDALWARLAAALHVVRYPRDLFPFEQVDTTLLMSLGAIAGATAVGYLAQPVLLRFAKGRRQRAANMERIELLEASGGEARRSNQSQRTAGLK
jgi:hypothetical protein